MQNIVVCRPRCPLRSAAWWRAVCGGHHLRAARVAVVGAALNGLISSSFYALVPAWLQGDGIERTTIGLCMLVAVLGGLAFQIAVGRLSDRFDRHIVLAALGFGLAITALALVHLPATLMAVLPAAAVLGGFQSTLYPVCVADAHDRMPAESVVAVSSQPILVSGIGSVVRPLVVMSVMVRFDIDGVLYLMAMASCLLALLAAAGRLRSEPPPH